jgi:hypothetical protein
MSSRGVTRMLWRGRDVHIAPTEEKAYWEIDLRGMVGLDSP